MDITALTTAIPSSVLALAAGVLTCFFGYRLRKVWVALGGLVFGFSLGSQIASKFTNANTAALVGLAVGVVLLLLCIWLYNVGIFLLCGGCAVVFVTAVTAGADWPWWAHLALAVIVFVIAGVLALHFVKPVLIVVTAFSGASSIVSALAALGIPFISASGMPGTICMLLCAVVGIVVQFSTARGR